MNDRIMNIFQIIIKITIDLNKKFELENPDLKQQINFISKLEKIMERQHFSSLKNQKKQLLNFYKILYCIKWKYKKL